jgi:hypothetical protein
MKARFFTENKIDDTYIYPMSMLPEIVGMDVIRTHHDIADCSWNMEDGSSYKFDNKNPLFHCWRENNEIAVESLELGDIQWIDEDLETFVFHPSLKGYLAQNL